MEKSICDNQAVYNVGFNNKEYSKRINEKWLIEKDFINQHAHFADDWILKEAISGVDF